MTNLPFLRCLLYCCATSFSWSLNPYWVRGQPSESQEEGPRNGLLAEYRDPLGNEVRRVDTQIAFPWGDRSPDPGIHRKSFSGHWRGQLLVRTQGNYRFHGSILGSAVVKVDGVTVLQGESDKKELLTGQPFEGKIGFREIEIEYRKTSSEASFSLYWSGPDFALEPLPETSLFFDSESFHESPLDRGRSLVEALRCSHCHEIPTAQSLGPAPALDRITHHLRQEWLIDWLSSSEKMTPEERRMPHFGLDRKAAQAIVAYLAKLDGPAKLDRSDAIPKESSSKPNDTTATEKKGKEKGKTKEKYQPSVQAGERHFATLGCMACHSINGTGTRNLFSGGDLSRIARKRPPHFYAKWLADPKSIQANHRMPRFELSSEEIDDLELYLQSTHSQDVSEAVRDPHPIDPSLIAEGETLIKELRCIDCHASTKMTSKESRKVPIALGSHIDQGCLTPLSHTVTSKARRPHFPLGEDDQAAILQFLRYAFSIQQPEPSRFDGKALLQRNNCLSCHPRGLGKGISDLAVAIAAKHPNQIEHAATLIPPSLNSVGDKLHDQSLRNALLRTGPVRRNWLRVRMPKYSFSDDELSTLVQHFVETDRIPVQATAPVQPVDELQLKTIGARLVTSDGFGCTSCHAVHDVAPGTAPINARGPNLGGISQHIRREWFMRWVSNPLRIVPRVEMPSITTAIPGVLDADLDRQIHSVWEVLNREGFRPPLPNPVRIARRSGTMDGSERALLITEVVVADKEEWIKPMLIGLPNRHNALINLEEFRLDGWWIGDAARLRNAGKRWYWEMGGENLLKRRSKGSDIVLVDEASEKDSKLIAPEQIGQFRTELDAWEHNEGGLISSHRLHFRTDENPDTKFAVLHVKQRIESSRTQDGRNGWSRVLTLSSIPNGYRLRVRLFPEMDSDSQLSIVKNRIALPGPENLTATISSSASWKILTNGQVELNPEKRSQLEIRMDYSSSLPVDSFPSSSSTSKPMPERTDLSVATGFRSSQLSLPLELMPTAFAWQPDGSMIVTSLQGNVWRAIDRDRDGFADEAKPISDELAVPFGVFATDQYIDVINKFALLRLWDKDQDGFAERTETLASGWGHSADYHDWAIGLPRTEDGGYLVAFACQQDKRSDAAAYLRGKVIKLHPSQPTPENPHRFRIEMLTGGHRFPIGIARNREGETFVTDNQGNYNPFNELNHIVPGARYGFINANEKAPGFHPDLTPPAVDIPHPWTRSVNGICFLDTPPKLQKSVFGPYEGHLVGCEYDTRRLVRMSLQRVGPTMQGAVYPLSDDPKAGSPSLLGPLSCAVSPNGDLMIGNVRETGWGAGQNTGNVVQMRFDENKLVAGIAEVQATKNGFRISFAKPISKTRAAETKNYSIASYTRTSTPQYGGDDQQRSNERIEMIEVADDGRSVVLRLEKLKRDFVYELHLERLIEDNDAPFFPSDAFYTMRAIP